MTINSVRVMVALALGLLGQGCTTYLYKGPTRPSAQVATVMSTDTIVDSVDGVRVREHASGSYARLELLPGPHRLTISLNRVTPGFFVTYVQRSSEMEICVELYPGHTYMTLPGGDGDRFLPAVLDAQTRNQARRCGAPQPPVTSAPADKPQEEASAEPGVPPSPPGLAATDSEEPPAVASAPRMSLSRPRLPSDAQLANRRPGNGLSLVLGGAFGGEEFVKTSTSNGDEGSSLSSGSGVIAGVGGMLTPLWAGDAAGFGLSANAAIKYDSLKAANGSASITRYPIAVTAHVLLNVSEGLHYIILKGGVSRDFGVNYTADFLGLNVNVPGTWGPTGTVGYYKKSNDVFAWDILFFFALTKHVVGTERIDANGFGLSTGFHWLL